MTSKIIEHLKVGELKSEISKLGLKLPSRCIKANLVSELKTALNSSVLPIIPTESRRTDVVECNASASDNSSSVNTTVCKHKRLSYCFNKTKSIRKYENTVLQMHKTIKMLKRKIEELSICIQNPPVKNHSASLHIKALLNRNSPNRMVNNKVAVDSNAAETIKTIGLPKVLILADSQGRECASVLSNLLKSYKVESIFKPSGTMNDVISDARTLCSKFTKRDFLIIWAGTMNITKKIRFPAESLTELCGNLSHTNVIMLTIPRRYDITTSAFSVACINNSIFAIKAASAFPHVQIRDLNSILAAYHYKRDGLHLNLKGKRAVCNMIADCISLITSSVCGDSNNLIPALIIKPLPMTVCPSLGPFVDPGPANSASRSVSRSPGYVHHALSSTQNSNSEIIEINSDSSDTDSDSDSGFALAENNLN